MHKDIDTNSKYYRWYLDLINYAIIRPPKDTDYTEKHHILPRCMGGSDDPENIVVMTGKAHYVAHHLLYLFTKGRSKLKMAFSWNMMSRIGGNGNWERKIFVNQIQYQQARRAFSKAISENNTGINVGSKSYYYDHTVRKFYNHKTDDVFVGTQWELAKYDPNISSPEISRIMKNPTYSSKGWMVMKTGKKPIYRRMVGPRCPSSDNKIYSFSHEKFGIEKCTRYDLMTKYPDCNFTTQGFTDLIKGRTKSHREWMII